MGNFIFQRYFAGYKKNYRENFYKFLITVRFKSIGVKKILIWIKSGCAYGAGFMVNYNDVAGPYSGIVFGMVNTIGTIPGIIAPYLVGVLTVNVTLVFCLLFLSSFEINHF